MNFCMVLARLVWIAAVSLPAPDAHAEIVALERARQEAFVRGDVDFLDRQTAEVYTTVNAAGVLSTKPDMMRSLRARTTTVESFELVDLSARVFGDVAVLTGIYRDRSSVNGRSRHVNVRFTRVFAKIGGVWQAVSYQQTPVVADVGRAAA